MAIKKCMVCGGEYEACPSCEDSRINPWKKLVCSKEHFQIRMTYFQWRDGEITDAEAKDILVHLGLTDTSGISYGYDEFMNKVLAVEENESIFSISAPRSKKKKK